MRSTGALCSFRIDPQSGRVIDAPDSHVLLHTEVVNQMPAGVGHHRIAECQTLTSPRIREIVDRRGIELLSYRDL